MNDTPQKTNWHSAAYSAIKIEFPSQTNPGMHFFTEYSLNENPRRVDMLIVRDDPRIPLKNPLGAIFRRYNLIEYKSPRESLDSNAYCKSLSYAYSFKSVPYEGNHVSIDDVTLTLISSRYPRELFEYLENRKIPVENTNKGMYTIKNGEIATQLIITNRLDPSKHIWLKNLTDQLDDPQEIRLLSDAYAPHQNEPEYRNFMNIIIRANLTAQKGKIAMCEALYELFAPQLKEQLEDGINQGIELGEQRINQLNAALARDNRSDELLRSFTDPVLQTLLLKEYHLL